MSKPRYYWHGYIKQILRHYPNCQTKKERAAVDKAIRATSTKPDAAERLELIRVMYIDAEQTDLMRAAYTIPGVSYATAKRWHGDFCLAVAQSMGIAPANKK